VPPDPDSEARALLALYRAEAVDLEAAAP